MFMYTWMHKSAVLKSGNLVLYTIKNKNKLSLHCFTKWFCFSD